MPLAPGTRLGPFEIAAALGAGGMGEVYRARDTRLGRDVAIKVLPEAFAADPDRLRRFEQEARSIAALNHPNICQLHDVGPGYLVLEYVPGDRLRGPTAIDEALRIARQVASALDAAHERGILRRDLKPDNIIVTRAAGESTAKLLDFGIAKLIDAPQGAADDLTRTMEGAVIGTAAYMSPEQADGQPLDARSEVFSFGAVLYELLSGRRPFAGTTTAQVLSALLRDEPAALDAPPAIERVVRRCLAKRPSERFQSMRELRAALDDVTTADAQPSIVVLPFENMSGDKENEYFSDGLAEEIINALTRVSGLKVIARTSAFAFKGKHEDVRRIAGALGVSKVLAGSVRKAGNRIRVTAQLIEAADGTHVWSERFDRELADVFAVQDEIAAAITSALKVTLSPLSTNRRHRPSVGAYDHYLKALHVEEGGWTPQSLSRAREHFERALALDPQFAEAHAEFGHLYHLLAIYGLMPPLDALPLIRAEATRSLELNPSLPEGHAVLGTAAMFDYDWAEAERQFQLAMAEGAASARVLRYYYAHYFLLPTGRAQEAARHYQRSVEKDPLNLVARGELAVCLRSAGRSEDADQELRRLIAIDSDFWFPYFVLGVNLALSGQWEESAHLCERAYRLAPWFKPTVGFRAALLKRAGQDSEAQRLFDTLASVDGYSDPTGPAVYYLVLGDLDGTADWAEKAVEERQPAVFFFLHGHAAALKSTPRWPRLAKMMNLSGAPL